LEQGFAIASIELPAAERPDKEWMYLPAFALIALVWAMQKPRQRRRAAERAAALADKRTQG
ncbi:MAG: DUF3394 domain-containing protein, partial [Thauera sp.]|nr:DUF3394 domain-containing protein [Thauera sp.]